MGWKREGGPQQAKPAKRQATGGIQAWRPPTAGGKPKPPSPEDDTLTALKKLLPRRSEAALQPVGAWLESECNVHRFSDLEGADAWSSEVLALIEVDENLSLGARGIIKELLKVLESSEFAAGANAFEEPEAEAEEAEAEAEDEAEEREDAAEQEEDEEQDEEEVPEPEPPKKKSGALQKSAAVAAARAAVVAGKPLGPAQKAVKERIAAGPPKGKPFQRVFLDPPPDMDEEQLELVDETRAEMEVSVEGDIGRAVAPVSSFEELGVLPEYVMEALAAMDIEAPLPIQAQALPLVLGGHDVTGIAKTGSGKTLAYLLPAVVHIEAQEPIPKSSAKPICLALAPTRELVVQICEEATKLVRHSKGKGNHPNGLWAASIYGGKSKQEQLMKARMGTHIMVATPGRLMDHLQANEILLDRVTYFVLDEADRMLEEGFAEQLKIIAQRVRRDRHMLFFSATWPKEVEALAVTMCQGRKKPVHLAVGQREDGLATTRADILQEVVVFNQATWEERNAAKKDLLYRHLREVLAEEVHKCLVFVSSKVLANELRDQLWSEGFKTDSMHGGRSQDQRLAVLDTFKRGETRLLVTTDVMGRGLDIPDITHVVIYDMGEIDDYVHRIGRTARGPTGQGHALTFFEFDKKWPTIAAGLIEVLEESGQEVPDDLREVAEQAANGGMVWKKQKYGHATAGWGNW